MISRNKDDQFDGETDVNWRQIIEQSYHQDKLPNADSVLAHKAMAIATAYTIVAIQRLTIAILRNNLQRINPADPELLCPNIKTTARKRD
tara:strand:- start:153 stop:422 length:270 start_codon:yes stop_codon:yes gene_type:complete